MIDEYGETTTRLENLPTTVKGVSYHDDDGRCFIVLNARMPHELNRKSYDHEQGHIERGELDNPDYREYQDAARDEIPAAPAPPPPPPRKFRLRFPKDHEDVMYLYRRYISIGDPSPEAFTWKDTMLGRKYYMYGTLVLQHRPGAADRPAKIIVDNCIFSEYRLDKWGVESVCLHLHDIQQSLHDGIIPKGLNEEVPE